MAKRYGLTVVCLLILAGTAETQPSATPTEPKAPSLEDAFRALHAGLSSEKADERLKALKGVLFEKKDIEVLVPVHAERLWKALGPGREEYLKHVDDVAKELTQHGAITKIEVIDIRKKKPLIDDYKRLIEILPKDIPICELSHGHKNGGGTIVGFVFVNKRWVFFPGMDGFPDALDKMK